MTHQPHYHLTIACPKCGDEIDVEFTERGRYEFAAEVPIVCDACGYNDPTELVRLAMDANDVAAERQGLERVQDV